MKKLWKSCPTWDVRYRHLLERAVAIEILPAQAMGDPARRRRFVQDIAEFEGVHFIVMQLVSAL